MVTNDQPASPVSKGGAGAGPEIRIEWLEVIAPLLTIESGSELLRDRDVYFFIDNRTAEGWLRRGNGPTQWITDVVAAFWSLCVKYGINPWIVRSPTGTNLADVPTRPDRKEIPADWVKIKEKLHPALQAAAKAMWSEAREAARIV